MADKPEIPGYKILEPLGEGGMAKVYLAIQENFQRKVAVKILSQRLLSDPSFGVRFLREARIVAQLSHQNIVPVFDVGQHGDCHYIAMELLRGGDLKQRLAKGMPLADCLEIVQQIASALHYASSKNFVHRDIKPENILFREDGSAVVSDFGIARSTESETNMTLTGTIIGTPSYMSPEQAQALTLDGRSDLYSLGIILFEMLTGNVPYTADSAISIGLKHITDPIPELPDEVADFQQIIDKALAKAPEERFQTGQEFIDALNELEHDLQDGSSSTTIISPDALKRHKSSSRRRSGTTPTVKTRASKGGNRTTTGGRTRQATRATRQARAVAPAQSNKTLLIVALVAVLAIAGAGGWFMFGSTGSGVSDAEQAAMDQRTQELLENARDALADGRLYEPADDSAQYYYTTALALAPRNEEAISGMESLITLYLDNAQKGIDSSDETVAADWLNRSAQIAFYASDQTLLERQQDLRAELFQFQQQNVRQSDREGRVKELLAEAAVAIKDNRLSSPIGDNAYDRYQSVLALDPENADALSGISTIAASFLKQSIAEAANNNFSRARALVAAAIQIDSQHPDLQATQLSINKSEERARQQQLAESNKKQLTPEELERQRIQSEKTRGQQIVALLKAANSDLKADRLQTPVGNNAVEKFRQVLQLDPSNLDALEGLQNVGEKYVALANEQLAKKAIEEADKYLNIAQKLVPSSQQLFTARRSVLAAREEKARLRDLEIQRQREIKQLLAGAAKDLEAGRLSEPLGNNALEKFSQVLVLDPVNNKASTGRNKIVDMIVANTNKALKGLKIDEAEGYIATLSRFFPQGSTTRSLKAGLEKAKQEYARLQKEKNTLLARAEQLTEKSPSQTNNNQLRGMYTRILQIEPDNRVAQAGLIRTSDYELAIAKQSIDKREYNKAALNLSTVKSTTPKHPALAAMQQQLDNALAALAKADAAFATADKEYLKAVTFADNNVARNALKAVYREILSAKEVDPKHPKIAPALVRLEDKYIEAISYYTGKNLFDRSRELIADAESMSMSQARLDEQVAIMKVQEEEFKAKEKKKRLTRQMGIF
ncbi:serine/threonine-protein kinase [Oceanicoccus sp. KOV_DT_Chl]|uniref:serine/threonine protein kinase n=1 Tax=Oceanicoccus sp. KOV_DT_Chl TaxID=1904639 RepID=UPI000C7A8D99|nr:serine/threonine-protein kinase [Oceanicoccus sp. KOV_DT_Chl]